MIELVLMQADVQRLNRQKFAEGLDHLQLAGQKRSLFSVASDGESSQKCSAHEDRLNQAARAGKSNGQGIVCIQGLLLAEERIGLRSRGFEFGAVFVVLRVQFDG